jgi:four helix bundle protein
MQDFRKLRVWERAATLAVRVRRLVGTFPKSGYSSMKDQILSAVESIPFNVAEGCGSQTSKEFARYLDIAVKSSSELEAELHLALRYEIVDERACTELADEVVQIRRMLRALRARVLS